VATVRLHPRLQAGEGFARALESAGFETTDDTPSIEIVSAECVEAEEVHPLVEFVLQGGGLLVCGGDGPLLPALHLLARPGRLSGPAEPVAISGEPADLAEVRPVSGVGYTLYRVGTDCVVLGGQRGAGRIVFAGTNEPPPALASACLRWISRQT
jgi:hypothetical protein